MMKTKRFFWLMLMLVASLAVASCSDDDDNNPDDPGNSVTDPEGTVTLKMRNKDNGKTYLPDTYIYIDEGNNFSGASFVSHGAMKGLGNVVRIPSEGWSNLVAVKPGCGYVAKTYDNTYIRIYVVRYTESTEGGIIGAEIKYQKPFEPTKLELSPDSLLIFEPQGGVQYVNVTTDAENWSVTSGASDWCKAEKEGNKIKVTVTQSNQQETIIQVQANEKRRTLRIHRQSSSLQLSADTLVLPVNGEKRSVTITTDASQWKWEYNYRYNSYNYDLKITQEGNLLFIETSPNINNWECYWWINICANERIVTLPVIQEKYRFEVESDTLRFDYTGKKQLLKVDCNMEWSAAPDMPWCTAAKTDEGVEVTLEEATDEYIYRFAELILRASNGQEKRIQIIQEGKETTAPYAVGDVYNVKDVKGVVYEVSNGGSNGKIISLDVYWSNVWSTEYFVTGATSEDDGKANMEAVRNCHGEAWWDMNGKTVYPGFWWCGSKNTGDITGWYLPAKNELGFTTMSTLDETLTKNKGDRITQTWSSTEYDASRSYYNGGYSTKYEKSNRIYFRAVHKF